MKAGSARCSLLKFESSASNDTSFGTEEGHGDLSWVAIPTVKEDVLLVLPTGQSATTIPAQSQSLIAVMTKSMAGRSLEIARV
ncbi:hypothetical protein VTN00DRAFT_9362 [Thermoascus crustaceus]|uniref:uncharacterized protein n=1 Tax=Thermoascus crustaceus TaxID=5088 RepID=UPI003742202F